MNQNNNERMGRSEVFATPESLTNFIEDAKGGIHRDPERDAYSGEEQDFVGSLPSNKMAQSQKQMK